MTMCSHCLKKLKRKEVPPTALVMEHRRVQNIVKQIDEKVYLKQVKGIEDEIGHAEKLVGIVHSKWKKIEASEEMGNAEENMSACDTVGRKKERK